MRQFTGNFESIEWQSLAPGFREKKLLLGNKLLRLLELSDDLQHGEWCLKGHTGFVVAGALTINIDGEHHKLNKNDVFCVETDQPEQRHIPIVEEGESVLLLLVEDS